MTSALQTALYPGSLRAVLLRKLLRRCPPSWFSAPYKSLAEACILDRPQYGYCMSVAATLAKRLGHKTISVIEFGVAGGNGLVSAERHAKEITREQGVDFQIYGFDGGVGLPSPEDYRDLPNLWQPGFYAMDEAALRKRLKMSRLVLGKVRDTCAGFFSSTLQRPSAASSGIWIFTVHSRCVHHFGLR